jgi:anthranilate/para-aminobenzoate synthase component II
MQSAELHHHRQEAITDGLFRLSMKLATELDIEALRISALRGKGVQFHPRIAMQKLGATPLRDALRMPTRPLILEPVQPAHPVPRRIGFHGA